MPGQPPQKYNPGELDKTRKNIGEVSQDEARRLKEKLGGEVGVERSTREVEAQYDKLKYNNKPGASAPVPPVNRPAYEGEPEGVSYFLTGSDGKLKRVVRRFAATRMKSRERIKTDFYCARPEISVKTTSQAFSSLLTLFMHVPDTVSHRFVMDADNVFGRSVENLVLAVRGLIAKSFKTATQTIRRVPIYAEILKILRTWDIEALGDELSKLQQKPHNRTVEDFIPLMKVLLKPVFLLNQLSITVHLIPALGKMYELGKQYSTSGVDRERLNRYYTIAREELPWAFSILQTRFYPLLLKVLSDEFMLPEEFYKKHAQDILEFLDIKETDVLKADGPVMVPAPAGMDTTIVQGELPVIQDTYELPPQITPLPRIAERGLDLLDRLFPKAGWKNLDSHPDLYAYFQSILDYPKGSELLPPLDPLQPVITLALVIQSLLAGFQGMSFGTVKNAQGQAEHIGATVEKAITQFHFFMEEVIAKHYLGTLSDLTRTVERSGRSNAEAKRLTPILLWTRKQYLLPHITMPVLEDIRPQTLKYPPLGSLVRKLMELLSPVAVEIEATLARQQEAPSRGYKFISMENPLELFHFQVENTVSQRLHQIFKKVVVPGEDHGSIKDGRTNRALLFSVLSLVNLLDQWINQPGSILYLSQPPVLFRTASGDPGDETPIYTVEKRDTSTLLKKQGEKELLQQNSGQALPAEENLPELYGGFIAQEDLKGRILAFAQNSKPFCIVAFRLQGLDPALYGLGKALELKAQELLRSLKKPEQVLDIREDGTLLLILPDADRPLAQRNARDILIAAAYRKIPMGAMVVSYQLGWSQDKLLSLPARGFTQGQEFPPQILGVYQADKGIFEFVEDLPVVSPQSPPEEWSQEETEEVNTSGMDEEVGF